MTVLSFWSESHRATPVDVFVTEPFDFEAEYARSLVKPLGAVAVRFVSIATLIRMKEAGLGVLATPIFAGCATGRGPVRGRWRS